MAFNFTGTFTTGQFEALRTFSKLQQIDIPKRISWLKASLERIGRFTTQYDGQGFPISYSVSPQNSYGAKLLLAFKILGGVPERDFIIRTKDQPVFKERGVPLSDDTEDHTTGYSETYSNGVRERGIRFDMDVGIRTDIAKKWMLESIKRKREYLEYKIKKCIDLSDQIADEIVMLEKYVADETLANAETAMILVKATIPGANNVVADIEDEHGTNIGDQVDPTSEQDMNAGGGLAKRGAPLPIDSSASTSLTEGIA